MTERKILILKSDRNDFEQFYIDNMQEKNIDTMPFYKFNKGILWKCVVLWIQKMNLVGQSIWLGDWKKKIKEYQTVIIFDNNLSWNIIKYIRHKNPKCRIIIWFWNIVEPTHFPSYEVQQKCELWSFDEEDCKRYGMKKNIQFYFDLDNHVESVEDKCYDALFIGNDKGRVDKIINIKKRLENLGYTTFINIVDGKKAIYEPSIYGKTLQYNQIIELINKSRCIIDIPQEGQNGMTIRGLESLFFEKKLITTDYRMMERMKNVKSDILIYDKYVSDDEIRKFMDSPYEKDNNQDKSYFTFRVWINNFGIM